MENQVFPEIKAEAVHLSQAHLGQDEMLHRVGQMTRNLHESLQGLGFDKLIEQAAQEIPDARDRLNYVARMTEQAAERVLNATDIANPLQEEIARQAAALEARWEKVLEIPSVKSEYNVAATETIFFIRKTVENTTATKEQLMEIMMAQDFQDLTGQVIKKITELAQNLEQQLVQLLIDFSPSAVKRDTGNDLMNGPQINPEGRTDVVADQEQVDNLLDSLGF